MAFLGIAPTGTVLPFAGSVAPEGWALCNGSALSRSVYSKLFAVIADAYGSGDGSSTFNIPDLRGVYPRGAGTNGTANYGGVSGHTPAGGSLGAKGGQKTAKNGLSNSGSNAVSGTAAGQTQATSNVSLASGAAASNGVNHTHTRGIYRNVGDFSNGSTGLITSGGTGVPSSFGTAEASAGASAYNHTHSVYGSTNISHTHPASSLTATAAAPTISGDTETTPAFLTLNYIIKL